MAERCIYDRIAELAGRYEEEVIRIRRDIHQHPELSFQEKRTSEIVANHLEHLGLKVERGIADTGVIGILEGNGGDRTIALRADMDALPLQEINDLSFKSVHDGVMHACGHDCHTANLLGVASILTDLKGELNGNVKFVFQPAEENGGGGREMTKAGILENPKVDAILGFHVAPSPTGVFGTGYGPVSAYSDKFTLVINGKKAHTSMPQQGVDAIVIAASVISALQSILSRQIDPTETATFSLGQINGGTAPNIVPDQVEIVGMMRCISKEARESIRQKIEQISKSISEGMGGSCEFIFKEGYPSVVNDHDLTGKIVELAQERYPVYRDARWFGQQNTSDVSNMIQIMQKPMLGSEDFGFYAQKVPACFFFIGSGTTAPAHNPKFHVDESIFKISMDLMASATVRLLCEE